MVLGDKANRRLNSDDSDVGVKLSLMTKLVFKYYVKYMRDLSKSNNQEVEMRT